MTTTRSIRQIITLIFAISVLAGYQYLGATWSEPLGAPTTNNVPAPLNIGSDSQVKNGALGVDALAVFGDVAVDGTLTASTSVNAAQFCDENGGNCSAVTDLGGGTTITIGGQCFSPRVVKECFWNWGGTGNETYMEFNGACSGNHSERGSFIILGEC